MMKKKKKERKKGKTLSFKKFIVPFVRVYVGHINKKKGDREND